MSTHTGHRQRMRNRFRKSGLNDFNDHEVLELLLYYCIPRRDTNEIAHRLCAQFGSFSKVLDAPISQLEKVDGIGENAATFLSLIREVNRYYQINRLDMGKALTTHEDLGAYIHPYFATERNESVYLLCLDAKCMALGCEKIAEGSVNSANVPIRRIVEYALSKNATFAVLAHNHPSGIATPSSEDMQTTQRVEEALAGVDIRLIDHIIVADDDYISMALSRQKDTSNTEISFDGMQIW